MSIEPVDLLFISAHPDDTELACAGTIWCLFAPTTRAWFSSRGRPPSGPQAGPGHPQAPPPGQRPGPW